MRRGPLAIALLGGFGLGFPLIGRPGQLHERGTAIVAGSVGCFFRREVGAVIRQYGFDFRSGVLGEVGPLVGVGTVVVQFLAAVLVANVAVMPGADGVIAPGVGTEGVGGPEGLRVAEKRHHRMALSGDVRIRGKAG